MEAAVLKWTEKNRSAAPSGKMMYYRLENMVFNESWDHSNEIAVSVMGLGSHFIDLFIYLLLAGA